MIKYGARIVCTMLAWFCLGLAILGQGGRWFSALDVLNSIAPFILGLALLLIPICLALGRNHLLLLLGAALLSGERLAHEVMRPIAMAGDGATPTFHVLSFNAWRGIRNDGRAGDMLLKSGADVILLQEAGPFLKQQRERLQSKYPYQSFCKEDRCDLAILSRWPMERPLYRLRDGDGEQFGPSLVHALIRLPGNIQLRVATLHLPRPTRYPAKSRHVRGNLAASLGRLADPGLIVGGDFNLTPWSFALQRLDVAMTPMTRVTRATWSYPGRLGTSAGIPALPIDQIYAGPYWRLVRTDTLPAVGSDHRPILTTLSYVGPPGSRER